MDRKTRLPLLLVAAFSALLAPLPRMAGAQQKTLLRYRPGVSASRHTAAWSDLTITVKDFSGDMRQPGMDSLVTQMSAISGLTDRVLTTGPSYVVSRTIDSVRAKARRGAGEWQPVPQAQALAGVKARVTLNDRLVVSKVDVAGRDSVPEQLRHTITSLGTGGVDLALPEQPVGPGDQWNTDLVFPFNAQSGPTPETMQTKPLPLAIHATMTLDSVVVQAGDTLAYVRMSGDVEPASFEQHSDSASGSGAVTGRLTGTMIWSTGWNGFVSGIAHVWLTVKLNVTDRGHTGGATMYFDIRNRLQVRA